MLSVWFWVALWTVLVVGTLLGALLLARWLWRSFTRLLAELDRAEERHGPAMIRLDAALDAAGAASDDGGRGPSMFADDLTTHHARLAAVREAGRVRKAARRERQRVTWDRWRSFNDPVNDPAPGDGRHDRV